MFKVFKTRDNDYILIKASGESKYISTLETLIASMRDMGTDYYEIEYGLTELVKNNHNMADFGIGLADGTPRFTFSTRID